MSTIEEANRILLDRLGNTQVSTDCDDRYQASMDNLRYSRLPSARIRPTDEDAVRQVLELANSHRVPVTARGAGSATTGASTPLEGGWVLDFAGWKAVHIDPVARMAFVQPGVTLSELDAAAASHGLSYPVDPGSRTYATVGGSIATNAGGMRGAKYGVTRDYVLSLEGFLPDGAFVRWGANLKKFSAGYNIRDLWVGAEGTLGIITGAVLRLIPRPEVQSTCLAVFPTSREALLCSRQILLSGASPSALEFLDSLTVGSTFAFWERKDPETLRKVPDCLRKWNGKSPPPAVLLIEFDGDQNSVDQALKRLLRIVSRHSADWATAIDLRTADLLWKVRKACSQAMFELGPRKLNEDVVLPFDSQEALLHYLQEVQQETGLPTPTFGHAADGNFHTHIMYDDADPLMCEAARKAVALLMRKVIELGGAISGEHGIGLAKSPFFALQHSEAEIGVMKAVKKALDPHNILNPGKFWEPSEPWHFPRETVSLPWDH
ncbi:MAG: FAD-linked oxidase C-terminal domain-containing protein [Oceanipulchritudo sp.]